MLPSCMGRPNDLHYRAVSDADSIPKGKPIQPKVNDKSGREAAATPSARKIILSPMIVFASRFRLNNRARVRRSLLTSLLTEGEDMKTRSTITKLIAITMALAAMAVAGSTWMAERAGANGRRDMNDIYVFRSPVGI